MMVPLIVLGVFIAAELIAVIFVLEQIRNILKDK